MSIEINTIKMMMTINPLTNNQVDICLSQGRYMKPTTKDVTKMAKLRMLATIL